MKRTLVVGYDGGLGVHVCKEMSVTTELVEGRFDVDGPKSIASFFNGQSSIDNIIYCAGVNLISRFDDISQRDFFNSMHVNCYGFIYLIQWLRKESLLNPLAKACIVTSNAANIPMSHSLSYNCSKAAANMMVRQMAREIPIEELTIFGVAPNKLKGTPMSLDIESKVREMRGWTEEAATEYQLAALPAHVETEPEALAYFIRTLFYNAHGPYLHGTILPYGGPM